MLRQCLGAIHTPNVAAFAPKEGQSIDNFSELSDELTIDSGGFTTIKQEIFARALGQDVNSTEADIMAVAQKPFHKSIFAEKSGPPAWKQLPTWYQVSENDNSILPDCFCCIYD